MCDLQLPLVFVAFHTISQLHLKPFGVQRLFEKAEGTEFGCLDGFSNGPLAGQNDGTYARTRVAKLPDEREKINAGFSFEADSHIPSTYYGVSSD